MEVFNMKENVVKLLKEQMWYLGTYSDEPNAIPVAFKDVTEDGKLVVGDVFLNVTLKNIEANGKIAVSACDPQTMEGYQIKGTAEHITEGEIVDTFKKLVSDMFNGAVTAKGALVITPEKVIVTTPGAHNGDEL
jgi:predicted pyridoxine 5'-phosphate oxidase superfamily flavin-nucleotide-binding protein